MFHEVQGISWLAGQLLASKEGLCSMELVWLILNHSYVINFSYTEQVGSDISASDRFRPHPFKFIIH
jgi:hypothetical protein